MKKLTLDLDALRVQSFATASTRAFPYGTVHGRQEVPPASGAAPDCEPGEPTRPPGCPADSGEEACPGNNRTRDPECRETAGCPESARCDPPPRDRCPGPFSMISCGGADTV